MRAFRGFTRRDFTIPTVDSPYSQNSQPVLEFGEIDDNLKLTSKQYRADIRTFSGAILENMRLPGGLPSKTGKLTGFKTPYKDGQLVVIGYINGNLANPIVMAVFPFAGGDTSKGNLAASIPGVDYKAEEVAVGNGEGAIPFKTVWDDTTGQVQFQSAVGVMDLIIDHTAKEVILGPGVSLKSAATMLLSATDLVLTGSNSVTLNSTTILLGTGATEALIKGTVFTSAWVTPLAAWAAAANAFIGGLGYAGPAPPAAPSGHLSTVSKTL